MKTKKGLPGRFFKLHVYAAHGSYHVPYRTVKDLAVGVLRALNDNVQRIRMAELDVPTGSERGKIVHEFSIRRPFRRTPIRRFHG